MWKRKVIFQHSNTVSKAGGKQSQPKSMEKVLKMPDASASTKTSPAGNLSRPILVPANPLSNVPPLFTTPHALNTLSATSEPTASSKSEDETLDAVLPYLTGTADGVRPEFNEYGIPPLDRQNHGEFARDTMERMNYRFTGYDPARPWLVYWACTALGVLGQLKPGSLNRALRNRSMDTFSAQQRPTGGFGGSHGHLAHLAPTYAAVLSLAMLSGQEDGVDSTRVIDREALWEWLGQIKQADGGFAVCVGGEVDVRGAYCAMTIISILNLRLELPQDAPARKAGLTTFTDGLKGWLRRCQTYEGGISGLPDSEAHGAYAFCALGCLSLMGDPRETIPEVLDVDLLISWLSSRQYAPEGGFSGRTNKLVDACYSHWVGGCWPLLEVALFSKKSSREGFTQTAATSLYNREGLIRYILCCCQADDGGLRDKPGKFPDGYHTCYTLAGLSSATHYNSYTFPEVESNHSLPAAFGWTSAGVSEEQQISKDEVEPIHPVFVMPFEAVERMRERFKNAKLR